MSRTRSVFVSHAHVNTDSVRRLCMLLQDGMDLKPQQLFCSSLTGQGLLVGQDVQATLHQKLTRASCVLAYVTVDYFASPYCMCELGAAWGKRKVVLPVLVEPVSQSDLPGTVAGILSVVETNSDAIDKLHDALAGQLGVVKDQQRWQRARDRFTQALLHRASGSASLNRSVPDLARRFGPERPLFELYVRWSSLPHYLKANGHLPQVRHCLDAMADVGLLKQPPGELPALTGLGEAVASHARQVGLLWCPPFT